MTSLLKKVETSEIQTQQELEKRYLQNIMELSTRTDRNVTIPSVIEDYKKAVALLQRKNIAVESTFHGMLFNQILAKLKAIGITDWRSDMPERSLYRNYLIEEVQKKDRKSAASFAALFSDDFIRNTRKDLVQLFYQAFSHYVEISVNLHQYTRTTIIQNNRISNSCFEDLKTRFSDEKTVKDIATVQSFLNEMLYRQNITDLHP